MATILKPEISSMAELVRESATDFRVHSSVYTDPSIFEAEMREIFEKSWVYVGHESEVAAPGDYITGRIGLQPIIVTRGRDNEINVLLNVCRHRANAICREQRGNTFSFRCPYHAWTYTNAGQLIGVADRPRYPDDFSTDDLNLLRAPRVGNLRGLIFASLNRDVPALDEYLAEIKYQIDLWADRSLEAESQLLLPHKYGYEGNWKFQAENAVDGYHPGIVHESAFAAVAQLRGRSEGSWQRGIRRGETTRGFPGGHSTLEVGYEGGRGSAKSQPALHQQYVDGLTKRHGAERTREIVSGHHLFIFPNVFIFDDLVRVIQPISVEETEIYSYPFSLGGMPAEFNARRLYEVTLMLSTTGLMNPADLEMFAANQTGLHARNMEWLLLARGMDKETVLPSGERIGIASDETPQRTLYRHWAQVMGRNGQY